MKFFKTVSTALAAALILAAPTLVHAQDTYVSVRVEPGVAIPVGDPQEDRFTPGFAVAVKPELAVKDIFSFGPSASVAVFNSEILGIDAPALWTLGGFIRLKRPHGFEWNSDEGAAAVSPWVDADIQYVRTGPLDRLGYSAAVGASWPVDEDRMLWMGPFVRYQGVHQPDNLPPGRNSNDSHTVIVGLSLEVGEKQTRPVLPVEEDCDCPEPEVLPPAPEEPKVVYEEINMELQRIIQFAWDSDKLDAVATKQLDEVVAKIKAAKSFKAIKVEGHASSEGQVKHNDKLSQRRAEAVVSYLIKAGIPSDKLSAVSFGSRVPATSNATEAGRIMNRRAEFVVNFTIVQEVKK